MFIGNRKIKTWITNQLIKEIKKKKELAYLADDFVKESLKRHLSQKEKLIGFLSEDFSEKSGKYKEIVKGVRRELRKVHGLYKIQQEAVKRKEYFEELIKTKPEEKRALELHKKILETHSSSRERLEFYERLYKQLFKSIGKPKTIVDLGCGLNPFSFPLMRLEKLRYYAYDISDEEISLIQEYFKFLEKVNKNFSGEAGVLDLRQWEKIRRLKKADACFLWKMTDVLEQGKNHKASEKVITEVPAKFVAVSFPTFTVKGRRMNQPRRKWIELMCRRLKFNYKIIKERNEIFYIIKK